MYSVKKHNIDAIINRKFHRILAPLQQQARRSLLAITPLGILLVMDA